MDPRPFTRPPERALIHNPNHQQPFPGFSPPTSQPQLPVHVPFSTDPYSVARRDPFLPSTAQQHVRRRSYGIHGAEGAQSERERHGGWGNTGTICACDSSTFNANGVVQRGRIRCSGSRSMSQCGWHFTRAAPHDHYEGKGSDKKSKGCAQETAASADWLAILWCAPPKGAVSLKLDLWVHGRWMELASSPELTARPGTSSMAQVDGLRARERALFGMAGRLAHDRTPPQLPSVQPVTLA